MHGITAERPEGFGTHPDGVQNKHFTSFHMFKRVNDTINYRLEEINI